MIPVELPHFGGVEDRRIVQQGSGRALDGRQRDLEFVADHAQELCAQVLQVLQGRHVLNGYDK